ncbi:MAG: hypothetical protein M1282_00695 [Chloroflexi bacterium]|nr:hypothetical protein [Chloroflexota bacterium]
MKLFKIWISEKGKIVIDGEEKEVVCYGGSNASVEEARSRAKEKIERLQRKINGDKRVLADYEVEIREEILQTIDDKSIITRNRYGAQVLNAENLMFLDIDKPKASFGSLFKKSDRQQDKAKIFELIRKLASSPKYSMFGFRLYETFQGARVIVLGKEFAPHDSATLSMMREFNCDPLYASICRKQNCFRARLTPKPYRMNMKAYKVQYPRDGEDVEFQKWLQNYEYQSRNFSTCKFIEHVGASHAVTEAVRVHDDITGTTVNLQLA